MASRVVYPFAALLCAVSAMAQSAIVPAAMNGVEGGSATNVPFGSSLACRYQCIYDANTLPWSGPRLINGLNIRADNGSPLAAGAGSAAKGYLVVSVMLSTTATSAVAASSTFADNRGQDRQWVLANYHLQLPAQPVVPVGPRPADIQLPFTTPFWFGATPVHNNQPQPANLMVEIWILSQPSRGVSDRQPRRLHRDHGVLRQPGSAGLPCPGPGGADAVDELVDGRRQQLRLDRRQLRAERAARAVAGTHGSGHAVRRVERHAAGAVVRSRQSIAAVAAVPGPGLGRARLLGHLDPAVTILASADAAGTAVFNTQLPSGSQYVGLTLFGQGLIYSQTPTRCS